MRERSHWRATKLTSAEILPFEDPVVCLEVLCAVHTWAIQLTLQIDGKGIWDCLEGALSKWPAQEGSILLLPSTQADVCSRFPIVSGLQVVWDHSLPPNQRVKSVHLVPPPSRDDEDNEDEDGDVVDFVEQEDGTRIEVQKRRPVPGDEVKREAGGRMYRVITREYMAQGCAAPSVAVAS